MAGMERLHRMFAGPGRALGHPLLDSPTLESSEQVYVSSLAEAVDHVFQTNMLDMLKQTGMYRNYS